MTDSHRQALLQFEAYQQQIQVDQAVIDSATKRMLSDMIDDWKSRQPPPARNLNRDIWRFYSLIEPQYAEYIKWKLKR